MNIQYFWIHDQMFLNFLIPWKAGQETLVEYFTKYHYATHNKLVRPIYPQIYKTPHSAPIVLLQTELQGCVDPEDPYMEKNRKKFPITLI